MVNTTIARSGQETTTEEPAQLAVDDEARRTVLREALRLGWWRPSSSIASTSPRNWQLLWCITQSGGAGASNA